MPEVPNGLALCRLHHSAFDADLIGIDADARVVVSRALLEERDGPVLQHGLKDFNGSPLHLPSVEALRPRREFLEQRFTHFQAA